jgi:hypothetical protein
MEKILLTILFTLVLSGGSSAVIKKFLGDPNPEFTSVATSNLDLPLNGLVCGLVSLNIYYLKINLY